MYVSSAVQQLYGFAFAIMWVVGAAILAFRMFVKVNAFLRRFEDKIDFLIGNPFFFPASLRAYLDTVRVMRQPHANAEIERLRSEMRRSRLHYLIWVFGFPLLPIGVAALLIATGLVHPQ